MSNPDQLQGLAAYLRAEAKSVAWHQPNSKTLSDWADAVDRTEAAAMAATVPADVLNVLRVALDRADMAYRATGFKPHDIEAAKHWVREAIAKG